MQSFVFENKMRMKNFDNLQFVCCNTSNRATFNLVWVDPLLFCFSKNKTWNCGSILECWQLYIIM